MNVFDCAIKIEEEAKKYYEKVGSESTLPEMKNLFSMLAASEGALRDSLIKLKESMTQEKAQLEALDGTVCSFRPVLTQSELMEELERNPDLYRLAMREEEKEIRFYEEMAMRAEDEATRASLLKLAEEGRRHLTIVENIYEFAESPKNYLAWGEFSNLREL